MTLKHEREWTSSSKVRERDRNVSGYNQYSGKVENIGVKSPMSTCFDVLKLREAGYSLVVKTFD